MERTRRRGETTDHRENEPPQVSVNGKVNHLLDWVKVWIIQVPQKPQDTRSEYLEHTKTILSTFFNAMSHKGLKGSYVTSRRSRMNEAK